MTHQGILAGIDEEILRLQRIRAALNGETNGLASTSQPREQSGAPGDHTSPPLQNIFTQPSERVIAGIHTRVAAQQREIGAKWSLY